MSSDESDNPYRASASEPTRFGIDPTSARLPLSSRLVKCYLRLVGGLQLLYGVLFVIVTFVEVQFAIEFHGDLAAPRVLRAVLMAPMCAVLALASLVAGIGTVRLRRRARSWQVVYLGACLLVFAAGLVYDRVTQAKFPQNFQEMIPLLLPYVPLIFLARWPGVPADTPFQTGATTDEKHFDH